MAAKWTLTGDIAGLTGGASVVEDLTGYVITSEGPKGAILDTDADQVLLGTWPITFAEDGTFSVSGLPASDDAAYAPSGHMFRVVISWYDPTGRRGHGVSIWQSAFFDLTADLDLSDVPLTSLPVVISQETHERLLVALETAEDIPAAVDDALATAVGPAVDDALAAGGILTAATAPALATNRIPDPQIKTSGGSVDGVTMPVTRITTGLPTGISYGIETNRGGSLSSVISQIYIGSKTHTDPLRIPVTAGEVITAAAQLWTDQTNTRGRIDLLWYNSSGTLLSTTTGSYVNFAGASTWEQRVTSATAPASAAYVVPQASIAVQSGGGNTVTGAKARLTAGVVVTGASTSPTYGDGTTLRWAWLGAPHASTSARVYQTATETAAVTSIAPVSTALAKIGADGLWTTQYSKNLYNPADPDVLTDMFINGTTITALSNYRTSGYMAVTPGAQYAFTDTRVYAFYDGAKAYMSGTVLNTGSNSADPVVTAPAGAAYVRTTHQYVTNPNHQVEAGAAQTAYEAYYAPRYLLTAGMTDAVARAAEGITLTTPMSVTKAGNAVSFSSARGAITTTMQGTLNGSSNGAYNIGDDSLDGFTFRAGSDEVAPLRTQLGTVGANHGYSNVKTFANPDGKDATDLGATYTDGSRQYRILAIVGGLPVVGGDYTTDGSGVVSSATVAPAVNLTHVSGGTHTAAMVYTTAASTQLYPSIGRIKVCLFIDGAPVTADGTYQCQTATVRETYDVWDYASIYDLAGANVGTSYATLAVAGAVRVTNSFRYVPGGVCLVETAYDELKPTTLGVCGAVQAFPPTAAGTTRYVPGIGTAGGHDWTVGVDVPAYAATTYLNVSEQTGTMAPAFSLDSNASGAWAMGYLPYGRRGTEASTSANRKAQAGDPQLWDMRSTKKIYPAFIESRATGWGRVTANAFRALLTPAEATTVLGSKSNAAAAWGALATVLGISDD